LASLEELGESTNLFFARIEAEVAFWPWRYRCEQTILPAMRNSPRALRTIVLKSAQLSSVFLRRVFLRKCLSMPCLASFLFYVLLVARLFRLPPLYASFVGFGAVLFPVSSLLPALALPISPLRQFVLADELAVWFHTA